MTCRVLFVESARDGVARHRQQALRASQLLGDYALTWAYAVEPEDLPDADEETLERCGFFGQLPLESIEQRLLLRLRAQIEAFAPQVVLIYTGYVFRQYREQVFAVLRQLRELYPELQFGRFGRGTAPGDYAESGLFDRAGQVLVAEELFLSAVFWKPPSSSPPA